MPNDDPHAAETVTGEAYRKAHQDPPDDRQSRDWTLQICTGILLIMAAGLLAMCNALSQL